MKTIIPLSSSKPPLLQPVCPYRSLRIRAVTTSFTVNVSRCALLFALEYFNCYKKMIYAIVKTKPITEINENSTKNPKGKRNTPKKKKKKGNRTKFLEYSRKR